MKPFKLIKEIAFILLIVSFAVSCAINPVTGKRQLMLVSEAQEIQMGAEYDPQVIATFGEYIDEQTLSFLQTRADEMGLISHRPNLKYHVKILDSPVVNAFAVPGGYIYLTRGILAQFNNEAELIGVLGHEMGHVTARHSVSNQSKQTLGTLLLIGGMIASEEFASYAEYALQGMQLLFLKFSRDNEREADQLGVAYSSQIGYDANKMADFFQVLKKMSMPEEQGGVPTFLSTHPDPVDRYDAVRRDTKTWQDSLKLDSYKVNSDSYLQMIDGIVYGEDPRQGFVEGNTFYHPDLKFRFSFPAGWKFENLPTQVNMAPPDGKALMVFTFAQGSSLDEAAGTSLQKLDLKPQESFRTTINNMPAIMALSKQTYQDQTTGQQQSNMIVSCFIDYNNTYYVFHGVTAEADYNTYKELFMSGMGSFSVLTDPSKLNRKPVRILVKRVQQTGTLADAFRYYGVQQDKMQELALLNNLELTDRVAAGKLIKVTGY
ncbi:MAG: M48 family metalloprotease [Bacteroidales bacterium]|nr:M48 family metalloprotease [Bacteroidales bacterium]